MSRNTSRTTDVFVGEGGGSSIAFGDGMPSITDSKTLQPVQGKGIVISYVGTGGSTPTLKNLMELAIGPPMTSFGVVLQRKVATNLVQFFTFAPAEE